MLIGISIIDSLKVCKSCGETKSRDEYYQSIRAQCKNCREQAKIQREDKAEQKRIEELEIKEQKRMEELEAKEQKRMEELEVAVERTRIHNSDDESVITAVDDFETYKRRIRMLERKVDLEDIIARMDKRLSRVEK